MPSPSSSSSQLPNLPNPTSSHSFHRSAVVPSLPSPRRSNPPASTRKVNSSRPSTAPSAWASSSSAPSPLVQRQEFNIPDLPPIPIILSHSPTRSHLFQFLLQNLQLNTLNQLILVLDLIAVIRGNNSQTNWSFDDPFTPPTLPSNLKPRKTVSSRKTRLQVRPGTSDGLAVNRRIHTRFTMAGLGSVDYSKLSSNNLRDQSSPSHLETNRPKEAPWVTHFVELYNPSHANLNHDGWFVPMPLPGNSSTLEMLSKNLPHRNQATNLNLGVSSLKQVGQCGCDELSRSEPVRNWWTRYSNSLWSNCAIQSKCQSFNDLLSMWPSQHFPTPSLSQLYQISNRICDFRLKMNNKVGKIPAESLTGSHSLIYQDILRGFFEVYLGHPSSKDLAAIERISFHSQVPAFQRRNFAGALNFTEYDSPRTHSNCSGSSSPKPTSSNHCAPCISSDPLEMANNQAFRFETSDSVNGTTSKLRKFFDDGHSFSPLDEKSRLTAKHLERSGRHHHSPPSSSIIRRRKSSSSKSLDKERPRKRSSTTTIDIKLANLTTSGIPDHEQVSNKNAVESSNLSQGCKTPFVVTQITTVGTSPTSTPTFSNLQNPYVVENLDQSPESSFSKKITGGGGVGYNTRSLTKNSEIDNECEARKLKRLTKLEKILGEPVEPLMGCARLGIKVVTEVVEDVSLVEHEGPLSNRGKSGVRTNISSPAKIHSTVNKSNESSAHSLFAGQNHMFSVGNKNGSDPRKSPSRSPSITKFQSISSISEPMVSKINGKKHLEKLHRLLGDVTHPGHQSGASHQHPNMTGSSGIRKNFSTSHSNASTEPPSRFSHLDFIHSSQSLRPSNPIFSPIRQVIHKKSSDFKPFPIQTLHEAPEPDSPIISSRLNSIATASTQNTTSLPSSSSSLSTSPNSSKQIKFSQRSARKLEKLLGEQIPCSSTNVLNSSDEFLKEESVNEFGDEEDSDPQLSDVPYFLCSSIQV